MAEYTVELRTLVESGQAIFSFKYPFYDESKRAEFEQAFIRHFYFREIGCETPDRFRHYLEDKMNTVFPYYNELMRTATIEYTVTENYDMKEATTVRRENVGRSSGVSSTRGSVFDEQHGNTTDERKTDTTGKTVGSATKTANANDNSKVVSSGSEVVDTDTTTENTVNTTETKSGTNNTTTSSESKKRFLDTPQGRVDLSDNKYLTTLHHDTDTGSSDSETSENNTQKQTSNGSGTVDTTTTTNSESDTTATRNQTETDTTQQDVTGSDVSNGTSETTFEGEQRSAQDNNTRNTIEGTETIVTEHYRHGNIGVQTATDMLEKHINLQKILKNIEKMFFEECEDLFMLVY